MQGDEDPYVVSAEKILKFLSNKFSKGSDYSALNSARAALSLISGEDITNKSIYKGICKNKVKLSQIRVHMECGSVITKASNVVSAE